MGMEFFDEVCDGFLMPGMTRKALAVCFQNYKDLEGICKDNEIHVFAMYGTLIGAIRGADYIPWDDDIDVQMVRDEYEKLKQLYDEGKIKDGHVLLDYTMNNLHNAVRNWIDAPASVRMYETWEEHFGFPISTCVDIFLADYLPKTEEEREKIRQIDIFLWQLINEAAMLKDKPISKLPNPDQFRQNIRRIEKLMDCKIDLSHSELVMMKLMEQHDRLCERTDRQSGDMIASMTHFAMYPSLAVPKVFFDDAIEVPFGEDTVCVPIGYDGLLRRHFGNYMLPVLSGGVHNYPFYGMVEKSLKELFGIELIRYHLGKDEGLAEAEQREQGVCLQQEVNDLFNVIREIHRILFGDMKESIDIDTTRELLSQCQELAICLGEKLEMRANNSDNIIGLIEKYCEEVYRIYQNGIDENDSVVIRGLEQNLEEAGIDRVVPKKEMVFLCYRSEYWSALHTLWETALESNDICVTVIAVPYYIKDYMGRVKTEDMRIDTDGFPEEVELTPYDHYDFASRHPDIIVSQCPYDEYHVAFSVHPSYYMKELRKHTDNLVLIPPFVTREVSPDDTRSEYSWRCFLETPGMIYADSIIAQSESMKQMYIEQMERYTKTEMCEEYSDFGSLFEWENKMAGIGNPQWDWVSRRRELFQVDGEYYDKTGIKTRKEAWDVSVEIAPEWFSAIRRIDGSIKKVLIICFTGSMLLEWGEAGIQKMKKARQIADSYQEDLTLLWYADPYVEKILKHREPKLWKDYYSFICERREEPWTIVADFEQKEEAALIGDMVYGDGCSLMNVCRIQEKPVLLENPSVPIEPNPDYEEKTWKKSIVVGEEPTFSYQNFIKEGLSFADEDKVENNGKRIFVYLNEMIET